MNFKFFHLFFLFLFIVFMSCSKDDKAKVLNRDNSSAQQTTTQAASVLQTPVNFAELLEKTNTLKTNANDFVSKYYPDPAIQSQTALRVRQDFYALPLLITQAITLLCTNTTDSNTLDFYGIPVSKAKASTLHSHLEQTLSDFSTAQEALDSFYEVDPLEIDNADALAVQDDLERLRNKINNLLLELTGLESRL